MTTDIAITDSGLAAKYRDAILLEATLRGLPRPTTVYHSEIRDGECIIWKGEDLHIEIFLRSTGIYEVTGLAGNKCSLWGRFPFEYWESSGDLRMPSIAVCILQQLLACEEVEG